MKYLLDTHVFLWAITDDSRMSSVASGIFLDGSNRLYLSVASLWEIAIKVSLGKLTLPSQPEEFLGRQLSANAVEVLPIQASHALRLLSLEWHHRDPFDRMIAAQSLVEGLPLVTADTMIHRYGVHWSW